VCVRVCVCVFVCGRMASRFYDTEGRATSKIVHTVPRPYSESSPADFASLYLSKSDTPPPLAGASYLQRNRDSNQLAVCTPSPLVHAGTLWPSDLSFGDITCSSPDPSETVFCNQYNVQSCLRYLNQVNFNSYLVIFYRY